MEDGPIQPGQYLDDGGKGGKKEAEQAAKETQNRLAELRMAVEEANRYEVEGLHFDKDQLSVLKNIAKRLINIESVMLDDFRSRSREVQKVEEKEKPEPKSKDNPLQLEKASNIKEILAAVAGIAAGFVAEFGKIFETVGKIFKEDVLAGPVIRFFQKLGGIFKADGAIGKLFAEEAVIGKAVKGIQEFFVSIGKLFGESGAIGKFFAEGSLIGKTISKVFEPFKSLFTVFAESATFIKTEIQLVSKMIGGGKTFTKFFEPLGKFFESFKVVGSSLGRIVNAMMKPLIVVMQVWSVLKGAFTMGMDEFGKGGNFIQVALASIIGGFTGFVNFFLDMGDMIIDAVSWISKKIFGPENPITKFLDSFSLVEMFTTAMTGLKDLLLHDIPDFFTSFSLSEFFDSMTKSVDEAIASAINFIVDFDIDKFIDDALNGMWDFGEKIFKSISDAFASAVKWIEDFDLFGKIEDGIKKIGEIGTGIKDAIVDTFNSVIDFITNFDILGTITSWWEGFKEDPVGGILAIIMAPINLITNAVSWIMDKLSFDKTKDALEESTGEGSNIFKKILKILFLPEYLAMKAIDFVLDKLGFDSLLSYIPDVSNVLSKAGEWISGLLDDAIKWFKDKLSFFGGGDDMSEEEFAYESALESGAVKRTDSKWNPLSDKAVELDQKQLDKMTVEEIKLLGQALDKEGVLTPDLEKQLSETAMFNMQKQMKKPGNVGTALKPEASVSVVEDYTNPSAVISGTAQGSAAMTQEMVTSQNQLDNTKGSGSGGSTNVTAANTTVSTSNVTNNSYTSMPMPSSQDNSDQTYIFRATGSSR